MTEVKKKRNRGLTLTPAETKELQDFIGRQWYNQENVKLRKAIRKIMGYSDVEYSEPSNPDSSE